MGIWDVACGGGLWEMVPDIQICKFDGKRWAARKVA